MAIIQSLGYTFLVRPLFNALITIYELVPPHDLGVAIIVLTLVIRFALFPFSHKALKHQRRMTDLQPKIKELQEKHKGNKQAQGQAMMALYKEHGTSPYAGCLPLLIQIPILFALYRVFLIGVNPSTLQSLYSFVPNPHVVSPLFFGIANLSVASPFFAIAAGIAQFLQAKTMFAQRSLMPTSPKDNAPDMQKMMGKQMTYVMPFIIVVISWRLPAALSLYWTITMLFSFVQQYSINRKHPGKFTGTVRSLTIGG